jgi:hypothetical protein
MDRQFRQDGRQRRQYPFDRRPVEGRVLALWKGGARID